MKRILFAAVLAAAPLFAQNTTLTATHISESLNGALLPQGQLCLTPYLNGQPSGFSTGTKQVLPSQTCYVVNNGSIGSGGIVVPDTALASPPGIGYQVLIEDEDGAPLFAFPQPIYPTGSTWSLDTWTPSQSTLVTKPTLSFSAQAPQGRCGTAPALVYTPTAVYGCENQIWVALSSGGSSGSALPITGGTLTGPLVLQTAPTAALQAATKNYVDAAINAAVPSGAALALTGGTLMGMLTLFQNPVNPLDAATKQYVDNTTLSVGGGTLTGPLTLPADPTTALQAVTKEYVDALASSFLTAAGGTLTGGLTLHSDPVNPLDAATKQYVDNAIATVGPTFSAGLSAPFFSTTGGGAFKMSAPLCSTTPPAPSTGAIFYCDSTNGNTLAEVNSAGVVTLFNQGGAAGTSGQTVSGNAGNLGSYNFDSGLTGLTASSAAPTMDSTNFYTPANAAHFTVAGSYYTATVTATPTLYVRFYADLNTVGSPNLRVLDLYHGTAELFNLYINGANSFLTAFNLSTSTSTVCAASAFPSGYHYVELFWSANASTGAFTVKIDGTSTCVVTGVNTGSSTVDTIRFGEVNLATTPFDIDIDNMDFSSTGYLGALTLVSATSGGSFSVPAASTSTTVSAPGITSTSRLLISEDAGLGAKLGVTCNANPFTAFVSSRVVGTSFTVTLSSAPSANPACFSWQIGN